MEGLRIAPEGEGPYKNAVRPVNVTHIENDEEVWPVDLNEVMRTTPMGNLNPESGWKDLSWTDKPLKPKRKKRKNRRRRYISRKEWDSF